MTMVGSEERPALCNDCEAVITRPTEKCPACGSAEVCDCTGCAFLAYDLLVKRGDRKYEDEDEAPDRAAEGEGQ